MSGKRHAKRRAVLFQEQGGLCHWCKQPMQLLTMPEQPKSMPLDLCTIDHLRDRFDPARREVARGERRLVAACWDCNHKRGVEREAERLGIGRNLVWRARKGLGAYARCE